VGAATEAEAQARTEVLWKGLAVARSLVQEGWVPGGGVALRAIGRALSPSGTDGVQRVFADALSQPVRRLALNAGRDPEDLTATIDRGKADQGIRLTGEKAEFDATVIESAGVLRTAMHEAAQTAKRFVRLL
jgi:chaperonin GroEL